MHSISAIFLVFIVGSSLWACVGRDRRPVVVATATKQSTSVAVDKPPIVADRSGSQKPFLESQSGAGAGDHEPQETVNGNGSIADPSEPKEPTKDKPASASGGSSGSGAPMPIRYAVNLPDGTTKILEWDGKALKGNTVFEVVSGQ